MRVKMHQQMQPKVSSAACLRSYLDSLALHGNSQHSLQSIDGHSCDAGEFEEEQEEEEEQAGDTWLNELNPNSQTIITGCMANIHLAKAKAGDR